MTGALWKDDSIHVVPDKRAQRAPIRDPYAAAEIVLHTGRWLSFNKSSRWLWVPAFAGTTEVVRGLRHRGAHFPAFAAIFSIRFASTAQ